MVIALLHVNGESAVRLKIGKATEMKVVLSNIFVGCFLDDMNVVLTLLCFANILRCLFPFILGFHGFSSLVLQRNQTKTWWSSTACWPQRMTASVENTRTCFHRGPTRLDRLRVWPVHAPHFKAVVEGAGALKCGKITGAHLPTSWEELRIKIQVVTRNETFLNKHCVTIRWVNSASSSSTACWPQRMTASVENTRTCFRRSGAKTAGLPH